MPSYLCLSVNFLAPAYHGRRDGGAPEWPPSPLRLFQALVAASAARWGERHQLAYAQPALRWLEQQSPPEIVAPQSEPSTGYRLSVPNNAMDIVARAWARGNLSGTGDASPGCRNSAASILRNRVLHNASCLWLPRLEWQPAHSSGTSGFDESCRRTQPRSLVTGSRRTSEL